MDFMLCPLPARPYRSVTLVAGFRADVVALSRCRESVQEKEKREKEGGRPRVARPASWGIKMQHTGVSRAITP
jgi:hypothetical protein